MGELDTFMIINVIISCTIIGTFIGLALLLALSWLLDRWVEYYEKRQGDER